MARSRIGIHSSNLDKSTLLLIGDVEINGANEVVILSDTVDVCIQKLTIRHQIIVFKLKSLKDVGCRYSPPFLVAVAQSCKIKDPDLKD